MGGLIIIEGPDGAGKTRLASELVTRLGWDFVHHGPYHGIPNVTSRYFDSIDRARWSSTGVVMDRSWLSEPIYGRAKRGGHDRVGSIERRMLERRAIALGALVVLALPSLETCRRAWRERTEYLDRVGQLENVWRDYRDSRASWDFQVITYDRDVEQVAGIVEAIALRYQQRYANPGPGHGEFVPGGRLVVVENEWLDARALPVSPYSFPNGPRSVDLTTSLELDGIGESSIYWVAAGFVSASLVELLDPSVVVGIGSQSARALEALYVDHVAVPLWQLSQAGSALKRST